MTKEKFKMDKKNFDFAGWATRNDLRCSDGRTIRRDAFKDNDGETVPLVWNHRHDDNFNVLGHALLENRPEGVYAYCSFNPTESGKNAKLLVEHGDVNALSIYANKLQQVGGDVLHGAIREVSLVLAGANPGAYIDTISMAHGEGESDEEAIIYTGEGLYLEHAQPEEETKEEPKEESKKETTEMASENEKTVKDVFDTLSEEQKQVVYFMIGKAIEDAEGGSDEEDEEDMKHNVFDNDDTYYGGDVLSHADESMIIQDAKRYGSLKEAFIAHVGDDATLSHADDEHVPATYGIDYMDYLFPDARNLNNPPAFIKRDTSWVSKVMGSVHHTPFSRIKSTFANITKDEARAKGYVKGKKKVEEVITLLKRTTTPQTIYKKQKLDRDDVTDITDFDVVAWLKSEMRMMLDEEIARAILIGDGRNPADDDKISEDHVRSIANDEDLYTIAQEVSGADNDALYRDFIVQAIKARTAYKGSGNPTLFTTEDTLTNLLLLTDGEGRDLYDSVEKLATKMRVKEIVTVEVMENAEDADGNEIMGLIVNMNDYNVGADKGGAVSMFDDFDIDYNQQKYLIETRCSGALIKPYSAIKLYKAGE
jgi:HK97 family phage major capsid protein